MIMAEEIQPEEILLAAMIMAEEIQPEEILPAVMMAAMTAVITPNLIMAETAAVKTLQQNP